MAEVQLFTIQKYTRINTCGICDNHRICNVYYNSLYKSFHCPYGTEYTYRKKNEINNQINAVIEQKCECIPGTYAHNEEIINTFSTTQQIDIDQYPFWDIWISSSQVSILLIYNKNTQDFNDDEIINIEYEHKLILWSWITESCKHTECVDATKNSLNVKFSYTNQNDREYTIKTHVVLKSNTDFFSLDSDVLAKKIDASYLLEMSQVANPQYKRKISKSIFFESNTYNINIQTCSKCNAGSFCQNGHQFECPQNSVSVPGSTNKSMCTCLPGYDGPDCQHCPTGHLCYGAGVVSRCFLSFDKFDVNCPCQNSYFRNKTTGICNLCPRGFFCPPVSLSETTGIDPVYLQFPQRCPDDSESVIGSTKITECVCNPGLFMNIEYKKCMQCPINTYCTGENNQITQCPDNSVAPIGSSGIYQCTCNSMWMTTGKNIHRLA